MIIEKNIPIPPAGNKNSKYPFHALKPGDSFFVHGTKDFYNVREAAFVYGQRNKMKFATREDKDGGRIWRKPDPAPAPVASFGMATPKAQPIKHDKKFFENMKVGEITFIEGKERFTSVRYIAYKVAYTSGKKFSCMASRGGGTIRRMK